MLHNGITGQGCEEDQDNGIVKGSLKGIEWDTKDKVVERSIYLWTDAKLQVFCAASMSFV